MKAIIFGANGQDGYFLKQLLISKSITPLLVSRTNSEIIGNIANSEFVSSLINFHKPEYIFHFAAISTTRHSNFIENFDAIVKGTISILEAVKDCSPNTKVFISGSAMQFFNNGEPINELTEFEGKSPYSLARISSVNIARYYRETFGIKIYIGYLFNHDSWLRSEHHVNQKIIKSVQRIKNNEQSKLILGNVNVEKEFNFAGDIVEAIWILINQNRIFEVIIGSGLSFPIMKWVEISFEFVGLNWKDYLIVEDKYIPEYMKLVSNPSVIKSLGWEPKVNLYSLSKLMHTN